MPSAAKRHREDTSHEARVVRPVGAESELHGDARGDPHREGGREELDPEVAGGPVGIRSGATIAAFRENDHQPQADAEGNVEKVIADGERELDPRQQYRGQAGSPLSSRRATQIRGPRRRRASHHPLPSRLPQSCWGRNLGGGGRRPAAPDSLRRGWLARTCGLVSDGPGAGRHDSRAGRVCCPPEARGEGLLLGFSGRGLGGEPAGRRRARKGDSTWTSTNSA